MLTIVITILIVFTLYVKIVDRWFPEAAEQALKRRKGEKIGVLGMLRELISSAKRV
jgi:hypothetical protein